MGYPLGGSGHADWHDKESHYRGKTHMGFAQIRDKIVELKGKRKKWDKMKDRWEKDTGKRWKDRAAEKERRERKEKEEREKERELAKERERERERRREKEKEKEKEREK